MATRIPVSWIILLLVIAVFGFFGYHILQASSQTTNSVSHTVNKEDYQTSPHSSAPTIPRMVADTHDSVEDEGPAPVVHKQNPIPNRMPSVPGQTEEDLRTPEQLQKTPPSIQYDLPEASDPLIGDAHMGPEFGSNLRHPEQMIESRITNTGEEFMQGIHAFDSSDVGSSFSLL